MFMLSTTMAKGPVDLLELPFTFTQLPVLMPDKFAREARDRGVELTTADLEALHRLRILTPFLRYRRDGRQIHGAVRRNQAAIHQIAHWHPTRRFDLEEARNEGRLSDPGSESFISRARLRRKIGALDYRSSGTCIHTTSFSGFAPSPKQTVSRSSS
jgi:hypothetical protein